MQPGELAIQPLLSLRGQRLNAGTWGSPSHLLNAAGEPSFFPPSAKVGEPESSDPPPPPLHTPGDQHIMLSFIKANLKIFCKCYQEGAESGNIPEFLFRCFDGMRLSCNQSKFFFFFLHQLLNRLYIEVPHPRTGLRCVSYDYKQEQRVCLTALSD